MTSKIELPTVNLRSKREREVAVSAPTQGDATDNPDTTIWIPILRWILFGIVLSLLPVFLGWLASAILKIDSPMLEVASHGELLLVSATLGYVSVGEIIGARSAPVVWHALLAGGASLLIAIISTMVFALAVVVRLLEPTVELDPLITTSYVLLLFSTISSTSCVVIAAVHDV